MYNPPDFSQLQKLRPPFTRAQKGKLIAHVKYHSELFAELIGFYLKQSDHHPLSQKAMEILKKLYETLVIREYPQRQDPPIDLIHTFCYFVKLHQTMQSKIKALANDLQKVCFYIHIAGISVNFSAKFLNDRSIYLSDTFQMIWDYKTPEEQKELIVFEKICFLKFNYNLTLHTDRASLIQLLDEIMALAENNNLSAHQKISSETPQKALLPRLRFKREQNKFRTLNEKILTLFKIPQQEPELASIKPR